jgi:hypothetical protein
MDDTDLAPAETAELVDVPPVATAPAPAPEADGNAAATPQEPAPAATFPAKGAYVAHGDGPSQAIGIVLDVLHDDDVPDRVIVGWFRGVSGPLLADDVDPV